ncbi:MAG: hypothetical protein SD837_21330 [Candidatus Electrothrix scaldis]|nr:MAG: hypothetical protein SD837_21330 [Candidatus Electrothrix sp. GW3-3]
MAAAEAELADLKEQYKNATEDEQTKLDEKITALEGVKGDRKSGVLHDLQEDKKI